MEETGFAMIHAYLCVGNNNWYRDVKMPALRSTMKLAITLVCTGDESGDKTILTTVLEGLREFYREFPRDKLAGFNSCVLDGWYKNTKAVLCSERHDQFKESTFQVAHGLFECVKGENYTPTSVCGLVDGILNFVFQFIEGKCGQTESRQMFESQLVKVLKMTQVKFLDDTEEGIIIRKRQYDLINMIGLIKYIFCQDATMVAFGRVLFLKMNYDFSGLHDEFMLDFVMRIVSNAGCCLTGLIQ